MLMLSSAAFGEEDRLTIFYTGSLLGQLESCGCTPKSDFGGVARIADYLSEHRNALRPYLIVDAGNFTGKDTPQGRLKAEAMIKALSIIKYDAVAISGNEQMFPPEFLSPILNEQGLSVISKLSGYTRSLTVKKGAFSINISADYNTPEKGKLNVLLTDIAINDARSIKGWDVIISSAGEETVAPVSEGKTIIVSGYPRGRKLGILTLRKSSEGTFRFKHTWHSVGDESKKDDNIRNILNEYNTQVAKLMKDAQRPEPGTTYVGAEKCGECHQPFFESWQNTRHARAFASLEKSGKTADPECIICHVIGFGEKGGFFSMDTSPRLANVQCESCHGLNREHLTDYSKPMRSVTEAVCLTCHTRENSPDFDYPVYLEKVKH